jgi:hypothetical protein
MTGTDDNWPPDYSPQWRRHIHAIGVIALRFSRFEACLYDLYIYIYIRLSQEHNTSLAEIEESYASLNDKKRASIIRRRASEFARDKTISDSVNNLMDYFEWCRSSRNLIIHSELYPKSFDRKYDLLHLTKPTSKQDPTPGYASLSVRKCRYIADRIEKGVQKSAEIRLRIRFLGLPQEKVHPLAWDCVSVTTLRKLRIPRIMTLMERP